MLKRILSLIVIFCFFLTSLGPQPQAHADPVLGLPAPGTMINLSPVYEPVMIKGLTVHKDNPFLFDFIVDIGQDRMSGQPLKQEGEKLIKYFLASLAIPDKDVWVNLSPYEKDRMIPQALGQTDMGRDLLEQDYILKQITASLIYPEKQLGRTFWDKVYAKALQMYGTTQVPVNTFNKVWIMADRAEVFEHNQTAFVVDSHLKVMLEEDYLALQKHTVIPKSSNVIPANAGIHSLSSQIIKQIILPELEKEVNTGKNFANLRQIFNSVILASWYKKNLKQALLNQVYTNRSRVKGINLNDPTVKDQIYEQYLKAYKKGVFNYIKEDVISTPGMTSKEQGILPRKYFSGGMAEGAAGNPAKSTDVGKLDRAMRGLSDRLINFKTAFSSLINPIKVNIKPVKIRQSAQMETTPFNAAMTAMEVIQEALQEWSIKADKELDVRDFLDIGLVQSINDVDYQYWPDREGIERELLAAKSQIIINHGTGEAATVSPSTAIKYLAPNSKARLHKISFPNDPSIKPVYILYIDEAMTGVVISPQEEKLLLNKYVIINGRKYNAVDTLKALRILKDRIRHKDISNEFIEDLIGIGWLNVLVYGEDPAFDEGVSNIIYDIAKVFIRRFSLIETRNTNSTDSEELIYASKFLPSVKHKGFKRVLNNPIGLRLLANQIGSWLGDQESTLLESKGNQFIQLEAPMTAKELRSGRLRIILSNELSIVFKRHHLKSIEVVLKGLEQEQQGRIYFDVTHVIMGDIERTAKRYSQQILALSRSFFNPNPFISFRIEIIDTHGTTSISIYQVRSVKAGDGNAAMTAHRFLRKSLVNQKQILALMDLKTMRELRHQLEIMGVDQEGAVLQQVTQALRAAVRQKVAEIRQYVSLVESYGQARYEQETAFDQGVIKDALQKVQEILSSFGTEKADEISAKIHFYMNAPDYLAVPENDEEISNMLDGLEEDTLHQIPAANAAMTSVIGVFYNYSDLLDAARNRRLKGIDYLNVLFEDEAGHLIWAKVDKYNLRGIGPSRILGVGIEGAGGQANKDYVIRKEGFKEAQVVVYRDETNKSVTKAIGALPTYLKMLVGSWQVNNAKISIEFPPSPKDIQRQVRVVSYDFFSKSYDDVSNLLGEYLNPDPSLYRADISFNYATRTVAVLIRLRGPEDMTGLAVRNKPQLPLLPPAEAKATVPVENQTVLVSAAMTSSSKQYFGLRPGTTYADTGILTIGSGRFLRALLLMVQESKYARKVMMVQPRGTDTADELIENGDDYRVSIHGANGVSIKNVNIINSVGTLNDNTPGALDTFYGLAGKLDLDLILIGLTDIEIRKENPVFQKLTRFLFEYRLTHPDKNAYRKLSVIDTDNKRSNGEAIRKIVLELADSMQLGEAFKGWLEKDVAFHNSMVDRIVARDDQSLRDAVTEPTPHLVLSVEGEVSDRLAALEEVPQFNFGRTPQELAQDFAKKLRVANAIHTVLTYVAALSGHEFVREAIKDSDLNKALRIIFDIDILPGLLADENLNHNPKINPADIKGVFEEWISRLANPVIPHRTFFIALDGIDKINNRLVPTIIANHGKASPIMAFAIASTLRFFTADHRDGDVFTGRLDSNVTFGDHSFNYAPGLDVKGNQYTFRKTSLGPENSEEILTLLFNAFGAGRADIEIRVRRALSLIGNGKVDLSVYPNLVDQVVKYYYEMVGLNRSSLEVMKEAVKTAMKPEEIRSSLAKIKPLTEIHIRLTDEAAQRIWSHNGVKILSFNKVLGNKVYFFSDDQPTLELTDIEEVSTKVFDSAMTVMGTTNLIRGFSGPRKIEGPQKTRLKGAQFAQNTNRGAKRLDEDLRLIARGKLPSDAELESKDRAMKNGGIDLNTSSGMQWKDRKEGKGVEMEFSPAMLAQIRRDGIDSLTVEVLKMTPIDSIWPIVGLQAPRN